MILADSSVWIDHIRKANAEFSKHLEDRQILTHPFVIGEILLGSVSNRRVLERYLDNLPSVTLPRVSEVRHLISKTPLYGRGIGWVDATLLAACALTPGAKLLTRDKRLHSLAVELSLA